MDRRCQCVGIGILFVLTLSIVSRSSLADVAWWLTSLWPAQLHWLWILFALLCVVLAGTILDRFKEVKRPTCDYQYIQTYEQSLRNKESLKVNVIHCMTVGPPHVGKTTLKNQLLAYDQLLSEEVPSKKQCKRCTANTPVMNNSDTSSKGHTRLPSTPIMNNIERIEIPVKSNNRTTSMINKNTWRTISLNDKLVTYLKKLTYKDNEDIDDKACCGMCTLYVFLISILFLIPLVHGEYVYSALLHPFLFIFIIVCVASCAVSIITYRKGRTADAIVREVVNKVKPSKQLQADFDDETLIITIRDCGGQPEFHEVLPALVSHSTLFLLMFNLDKGLDRQYEVTYKTNDNEISDPYISSFTVKQSLLQCLASIKSIGCYCISLVWDNFSALPWKKTPAVVHIKTTTNALIIATHKDLLVNRAVEVEKIRQHLEREIKRTDWYSSDMIVPTPDRHLVLAIDTFDQTDINTVKEMISGTVLNREPLEVPVPWLALEFCIQKLNKPVMSLKEVRQLASECNIYTIDNEFPTALWFLHHVMGTIRYFGNVPEMRNTVITDPQVLFDLVTDLIVQTFSFANMRSLHHYEQFRSSGRFIKHHLRNCKTVKEELLTEEQIIALLQHLNIIAPVGVTDEGEREYFLPCVLVHATLPPSSSDRSTTTAVAAGYSPLLITFKCQYTPRGMFSCLIAHILRTSQGQWKLASDKIYRNQVEFHHVDSGHLVLIRNFFKFLEVTINLSHSFTVSTIPFVKIQQFLAKCLEEVRKLAQLNYSSTEAAHMFAFYCSQDHSSSTAAAAEPHPAVCVTDVTNPHTVCSIDTTLLRANLTPEQTIWFNDDTSNLWNPELCIKDLDTVIGVLRNKHFDVTKWYQLGLRLGLYDTRLKQIQSDNRSSIDCLYSCLSDWLRQVDKVKKVGIPTWVALATALESVGEHHIADNLHKYSADFLV